MQGGEAARMAEQLPDRDCPPGPPREAVEILRSLAVQVDLSRLDQLHHGQRREALGDRASQESRLRRDFINAPDLDNTVRTNRCDLAIGHDGVGQARHAGSRHLTSDEILYRSIRCTRMQGGTETKCKDSQSDVHDAFLRRHICVRTDREAYKATRALSKIRAAASTAPASRRTAIPVADKALPGDGVVDRTDMLTPRSCE